MPPPVTVREAIRRSWQLPALGGSVLLLGAAIGVAIATAPDPDYDGRLRSARELIEGDRFEDAIGYLNERVLPEFGSPEFHQAHRRGFHLLMGRALYGGNQQLASPQLENNRAAVLQYLEAERLGAALDPADHYAVAESLLLMDEHERALDRAARIGDHADADRRRITRRIIEARIREDNTDYEAVLGTLAEMLTRPGVPETDRVWALERQADVRHALGYHDETINQLLRQIPAMVSRDPGLTAGLHAALARAYFALGAIAEAGRELDRIADAEAIPEGTPLRARVLRLRGQVTEARAIDQSDLEAARTLFARVTREHASTDEHLPALLGLARVTAALEDTNASLDSYSTLVAIYNAGDAPTAPDVPTRGDIARTLLDETRTQLELGATRIPRALAFATEAGNLYSLEEMPPEVIEALWRTHEAMAGRLLRAALGLPPRDGVPSPFVDEADLFELARLDPATGQQIKRHLIRAAAYARRHADRFVIDDIRTYADSLWSAARLFDLAGDADEAVRAYEEFHTSIQDEDRAAEALYRLALAYQAAGRFDEAQGYFASLMDRSRSEGVRRVGPWADRALVPFARSIIHDDDPANDGAAEEMLEAVLTGNAGGPESEGFDDALFEYAALKHHQGRHNETVQRAGELLTRFPDYERAIPATYLLADAHRMLASRIDDRLREALAASARAELERRRTLHLETALESFGRVRDAYRAIPPARLTSSQALELRNAHFYLGDCAFDLGDVDAAIGHYSVARARYPRDPAVLVALTQIVSAYIAKGDLDSARAANERARDFYASLPEEAWDDPALPMDRADWERWLDSSATLYQELARGG